VKAPPASFDCRHRGQQTGRPGGLERAATYLDRACVLGVELDDGLAAAGYLDLVLRAEPRHDCIVPRSVSLRLLLVLAVSRRTFDRVGAPVRPSVSSVSPLPRAAGVPTTWLLLGAVFWPRGRTLPASLTLCGGAAAADGGMLLSWYRHVSGHGAWLLVIKAPLLARRCVTKGSETETRRVPWCTERKARRLPCRTECHGPGRARRVNGAGWVGCRSSVRLVLMHAHRRESNCPPHSSSARPQPLIPSHYASHGPEAFLFASDIMGAARPVVASIWCVVVSPALH
jgi:hypothetical protein